MSKKKGFFGRIFEDSAKSSKRMNKLREKGFVCNSCNYRWMSKKDFGEPGKCQKCNSLSIRRVNVTNYGIAWHAD